jgi:S-adenosylmethionine decarboxylase proenzyme
MSLTTRGIGHSSRRVLGSSLAAEKARGEWSLSNRELELLSLLAQGHQNREIVEATGLSYQTVKNLVSSATKKLGAKNRTHAAIMARDLGLAISDPDHTFVTSPTKHDQPSGANVSNLGNRILLKLRDGDLRRLDDLEFIEKTIMLVVQVSGTEVVDCSFHHFSPSGVTGLVATVDGYVSVHTWPEHGCSVVDLFTDSEYVDFRASARMIASALGGPGSDVVEFGSAGYRH